MTPTYFKILLEERKELNGYVRDYDNGRSTMSHQDYLSTKTSLKSIDRELEKFPKVNVSFMSGYRTFYRSVFKVGKSYYCNGEKMTKGRGYRCVEEIPSITDKMKEEMVADSYYY